SFGIGSAQSGVGPSTYRLTSFVSGALTSTSTFLSPSRLTSRIVIGVASPIFAGFGTVSSAAARLPSSVLATLEKVSSLLAATARAKAARRGTIALMGRLYPFRLSQTIELLVIYRTELD